MLTLIKIGESKYIEDMYNNEYLHFSCIEKFRNITYDKSGRLDSRELNIKNEQLDFLTFKYNNHQYNLHTKKNFNGQYMENLSEVNINCCSLSWQEIEPDQVLPKLNSKLLELGDKALLIFDYKEFFNILDNNIRDMKLLKNRDRVSYYDPKVYNGTLTLHHKDIKFEYQNEYRILIAPTQKIPIDIHLPGLKLISKIMDMRNLI